LSRLEENAAVRRAIDLGRRTGGRLHIAHVSTAEAVELIRQTKAALRHNAGGGSAGDTPFTLSCEATPHHIALTCETARALGEETFGRVNPPLRTEADRQALIGGLLDGTIDAIATDHAPHTMEDKTTGGAPGFSGLETAFAVCFTELVRGAGAAGQAGEGRPTLTLSRLSALMSAAPARLLGLGGEGPQGRGRIAAGLRADLTVARIGGAWTVDPRRLKSRGKNSPFAGRTVSGQILLTLRQGRIVYQAPAASEV
jgi:dihydroorotase